MAPIDFGNPVNPISIRRTDYIHHITALTAPPPGFFRPSYDPYYDVSTCFLTILDGTIDISFSM